MREKERENFKEGQQVLVVMRRKKAYSTPLGGYYRIRRERGRESIRYICTRVTRIER